MFCVTRYSRTSFNGLIDLAVGWQYIYSGYNKRGVLTIVLKFERYREAVDVEGIVGNFKGIYSANIFMVHSMCMYVVPMWIKSMVSS